MVALNTSVFDKVKTFADYDKIEQDFQLRKALAAQQIQTGGIDAASKANIYKTQLLSGAAAGGQQAFDKARQTLTAQGIDISDVAPDVETGMKQLQAARLAQSPLGTLFNAAQKDQSNQIALGGLTGNITPGARSPSIPGLTVSPITGQPSIQPTLPDMVPAPVPVMSNDLPASAATNNAMQAMTGQNVDGSVPPLPAGATPLPPAPPALAAAQAIAPFNFRKQGPDESLPAYKDAQQQAFEQYKADPNYQAIVQQQKSKAEALGKDQGSAVKDSLSSKASYDQVDKTLQGIEDLVKSPAGLPQSRYFVPAGAQAALAQNIGGTSIGNALGVAPQAQADNANAFSKLNEAQTIGAMRELANTGQIKMTRTLENILNRGYLVEPGASNSSKIQQAELIRNELKNSYIAAHNVDAGLNGGQQESLVPALPQAVAPQMGETKTSPTGTYLFNGGDPSDKNSWKKIK